MNDARSEQDSGTGRLAPGLDVMPGHLIRRLQQSAVAIVVARLSGQGHDITPVQFAAMKALDANPGCDQASVSDMIAYDRATIGGVIERLVNKGLVSREVSTTDRRARVLHLTPQGRNVLRAIEPLVAEAQDEILSPLSPAERQRFLEALSRCVAVLESRKPVANERAPRRRMG